MKYILFFILCLGFTKINAQRHQHDTSGKVLQHYYSHNFYNFFSDKNHMFVVEKDSLAVPFRYVIKDYCRNFTTKTTEVGYVGIKVDSFKTQNYTTRINKYTITPYCPKGLNFKTQAQADSMIHVIVSYKHYDRKAKDSIRKANHYIQ